MKLLKRLFTLLLAGALLLAPAACGDDAGDQGGTTETNDGGY